MDKDSLGAIIEAALDWKADSPEGPSGPVLARLSQLAETSKLREFAEVFFAYGKAKPSGARYVEGRLASMIRERYLLKQPGITPAKTRALESTRPTWATELREAASNPGYFEHFVAGLVRDLQRAD